MTGLRRPTPPCLETPASLLPADEDGLNQGSKISYLWIAGHEGMEKEMETTIMGCIGATRRIHSLY